MVYQNFLLVVLVFIATTWAAALANPVLFHGTSTFIFPRSNVSSNSTYTADFFCYMTERGYLSFGWWMLESDNSSSSQRHPDMDSFHWLELGESGSCNDKGKFCLYRTRNILVWEPDDLEPVPFPRSPMQTIAQSPSLWRERYDQITLTYMDGDGVQAHGVGTSQMLGGEPRTVGECHKVLRILKRAYETYDIDLGFEIGDPCIMEKSRGPGTISEL
ncbi:hypothetical protein GGS26DRAFT_137709 [Hypomontagnella submonticulosa]|nr:hypothetical protein GGS26DRAFT_137709 [Hypomontagnella submonticulosa]